MIERKNKLAFLAILILSGLSCGQCVANIQPMNDLMASLQTFGYPLGFLMMLYMGVKWIISEGPQARENARRGLIYVVIGILLLRTSQQLVYYLLCF